MKIEKADSVGAKTIEMDGAEGVEMRMLIGPVDGAPSFNMRQFTLSAGGFTPRHSHAWEHEVYVLAGSGTVLSADGEKPISPGDCIFMPGGELHQFRNAGEGELKFLCLVPQTAGA